MIGKNIIMNWWIILLVSIISLFLLLLILLIFFIIFGSVIIKIYKRENQHFELDLIFNFLIIKRFDIDEYMNYYLQTTSFIENVKALNDNIKMYLDNHEIIKKYLKQMTVKKITLIPQRNSEDPTLYPYLIFINWQLINIVKYMLEELFGKVEKEYYQVIINDEEKTGLNLDLEIKIKIIKLVIVSFKNIKATTNLIKTLLKKQKEKKNGKARKQATN